MNTTPIESSEVIYWMKHFIDIEGGLHQEIYKQLYPLWQQVCEGQDRSEKDPGSEFVQAVQSLHASHPEFVRVARIDWALMSLFEGRDWRRSSRERLIRVGHLPALLESSIHWQFPSEMTLWDVKETWIDTDHTKDGWGLGVVGPYGSGKALYSVRAAIEMFKRFPFRSPYEAETLDEPKGRTASFFRAAEIAKAFGDLSKPDDSFEFAVASGIIDDCRYHEVLVISSLGEIPMNTSESAEFLNLLEHRKLQCRPTLWTTQFHSVELRKRFSPRLASLIVERLTKSSKIVKLGEAKA